MAIEIGWPRSGHTVTCIRATFPTYISVFVLVLLLFLGLLVRVQGGALEDGRTRTEGERTEEERTEEARTEEERKRGQRKRGQMNGWGCVGVAWWIEERLW